MNFTHQKKLYLCCNKEKKNLYKKKIKSLSFRPILIMNHLNECDEILVIGNYEKDKDMQDDILLAKEYGICTKYVNLDLIPHKTVQHILEGDFKIEKSKFSEYTREYDYER